MIGCVDELKMRLERKDGDDRVKVCNLINRVNGVIILLR